MNTKTFLLLGCLLASGVVVMAQTNRERARVKVKEAVRLMEDGKTEASLLLFDEAVKLDPYDPDILYEKGLAYYDIEDYKEAGNIMKQLLKANDPGDKVYRLLGFCYEMLKDPENAIGTYEEGMKYYPKAGSLYAERGQIAVNERRYDVAIGIFEKGIEMDPSYPNNYYWAAKVYCMRTDMMFRGMIYGEIFVNLERHTKRTEQISQLLYNTYGEGISFPADADPDSHFAGRTFAKIHYRPRGGPDSLLADVLFAESMKGSDTSRYGADVYDPVMRKALVGERAINLASLNRIRGRFLEQYAALGFQERKPVVLFDYLQEVKAAGHLEAYNYWTLSNGNPDAFAEWRLANNDKLMNYVAWRNAHPFFITEQNKFCTEKY